MARYIREVELKQPEDFVQYIMTDFLSKQGFRLEEFKGELVYRAGGGLVEIPKFLVWGYQNGVFHVEAWTRNCWLPGVYGGENAMTGFMGCIPKSAYKNDIEELIGLLFQPLPSNQGMQSGMAGNPVQPGMQSEMTGNPAGQPEMTGNPSGQPKMAGNLAGQPGMQPGMNGQQPIYVKGADTSKYATMSLVFSLISLVGILVPLVGILFGAMGITYGKKGMRSEKKGMATAAFVISIIGIVLAVFSWAINILLLFL